MKKSKHREKPPFTGTLFMRLPGGAEVKLNLPKAEGYQLGETAMAEGQYKGRPVKAPVMRVAGGWDLSQ